MAGPTRADGPRDPVAVGQDVARILTALHVPYLVAGSLGSSIHGEPRATLDVDMVVDLKFTQVPALVGAMHPAYYIDESAAGGAVASGSTFSACG